MENQDNPNTNPPDEKQLAEWRLKFPGCKKFVIIEDEKKYFCYVKKPKMVDLDASITISKKTKSDLKFSQTLFARIKLWCDPKILADEDDLSAIYGKIDELMKKVDIELEEL